MKTREFDPSELISSQDDVISLLEDAFASQDSAYIANALGIVARAKGISTIAKETGLNRSQLYKSLSKDGNPTAKTLIEVLKSFGLILTVRKAESV
ncbi:MAG: putative addiction module antidote protein [Succinivibrio sp.]|nr:putative addiction module antidote protein [Succinivibrio sp.]